MAQEDNIISGRDHQDFHHDDLVFSQVCIFEACSNVLLLEHDQDGDLRVCIDAAMLDPN